MEAKMNKLYWKIYAILLFLLSKKTMGARALVIQEDQILLVKHTYISGWCTIGGGIDPGESGVQALKRELMEEVGIELFEEPPLLGLYHNPKGKRDDYVVLYVCKKFKRHDNVTSPEILDSQWFSLHNLPPDIAPGTKRRIEEYLGTRPLSDKW